MSTTWHGFLTPLLPPGSPDPGSPYVGARGVRDEDLPAVTASPLPLRVVLTGGAAQVAGPWSYAARAGLVVSSLDTALRDPEDRVGNLRRVVAALDDADVPDDVPVHVRVPGPPSASGLALLDELALRGVLAVDPADPHLEAWVDAALDREVPLSLVGRTPAEAVDAVLLAARLWGDEGEVAVGRRFVSSWLTPDVEGALAHLARLDRPEASTGVSA